MQYLTTAGNKDNILVLMYRHRIIKHLIRTIISGFAKLFSIHSYAFNIFKRILFNHLISQKVITDVSVASYMEFYSVYNTIEKHVRINMVVLKEILCSFEKDRNYNSIKNILPLFCWNHIAHLKHGDIIFTDNHAMWVLLNEIIVDECYYFECSDDAPLILDCGTNFGLSIYYFKSLYPNSHIIGFEPAPEARKLAIKNINYNKYCDVEILPYALSVDESEQEFVLSKSYSMAGSLTDRRRNAGDDIHEITVKCKKLSTYLKQPVNFLKLDIEGVEDTVLHEARDYLKNIQYIFCEYHHGLGLPANRLEKILSLLNDKGFEVQVAKSWSGQNYTSYRPINHLSQPYSLSIWAKNKNW